MILEKFFIPDVQKVRQAVVLFKECVQNCKSLAVLKVRIEKFDIPNVLSNTGRKSGEIRERSSEKL